MITVPKPDTTAYTKAINDLTNLRVTAAAKTKVAT